MSKPQSKVELRRQYLLEKYVWKWKQFMRARTEGLFPRLLKLSHNNWLRQVTPVHYALNVHPNPLFLIRIYATGDGCCHRRASGDIVVGCCVVGALHACHPSSQAGRMYHRGGPHHHPQPQAASPGPAHQVGTHEPGLTVQYGFMVLGRGH